MATLHPDRMLAAMSAFAFDLARALGWQYVITSHCRSGPTAHARCAALDIAFRSGPLHRSKLNYNVGYYRDDAFIETLLQITQRLSSQHPAVSRVLVELDHLHIDHGSRVSEDIGVGVFAPGKCHKWGCEEVVSSQAIMLRK